MEEGTLNAVRPLLVRPEFPRSASYDLEWMLTNQMGPNAVWLSEWLAGSLCLEPGMRVLDLGCGRAMSSIFLAREHGVRVWAADLWMSPDHNWRRVVEAGVEDLVCPLRLEAHALPFPHEFFDAVVSIDAYQYFGTDELYLGYLSGFLRPAGQLGIVVPGLMQELQDDRPPQHLLEPQANGKVFWEDECRCFKTAGWWAALWRRCGAVRSVETTTQPDGWRHWRDFERAIELAGTGIFPSDAEALDRDGGRYLGFIQVRARRSAADPGLDLYDAGLGARLGVDD